MQRLVPPLLISFAVVLLGFGLRPSAAAAINQIYLPVINCPTCNGSVPVSPSPTPDLDTVEPVRRELLALVNAARAEVGCPAAREDPLLMRITQEWSVYRATVADLGHASNEWYISRGAGYAQLENIGGAHADATHMFNGWMNSPGHRINMLTCYPEAYGYVMGVGYFDNKWTFAIGWHFK